MICTYKTLPHPAHLSVYVACIVPKGTGLSAERQNRPASAWSSQANQVDVNTGNDPKENSNSLSSVGHVWSLLLRLSSSHSLPLAFVAYPGL